MSNWGAGQKRGRGSDWDSSNNWGSSSGSNNINSWNNSGGNESGTNDRRNSWGNNNSSGTNWDNNTTAKIGEKAFPTTNLLQFNQDAFDMLVGVLDDVGVDSDSPKGKSGSSAASSSANDTNASLPALDDATKESVDKYYGSAATENLRSSLGDDLTDLLAEIVESEQGRQSLNQNAGGRRSSGGGARLNVDDDLALGGNLDTDLKRKKGRLSVDDPNSLLLVGDEEGESDEEKAQGSAKEATSPKSGSTSPKTKAEDGKSPKESDGTSTGPTGQRKQSEKSDKDKDAKRSSRSRSRSPKSSKKTEETDYAPGELQAEFARISEMLQGGGNTSNGASGTTSDAGRHSSASSGWTNNNARWPSSSDAGWNDSNWNQNDNSWNGQNWTQSNWNQDDWSPGGAQKGLSPISQLKQKGTSGKKGSGKGEGKGSPILPIPGMPLPAGVMPLPGSPATGSKVMPLPKSPGFTASAPSMSVPHLPPSLSSASQQQHQSPGIGPQITIASTNNPVIPHTNFQNSMNYDSESYDIDAIAASLPAPDLSVIPCVVQPGPLSEEGKRKMEVAIENLEDMDEVMELQEQLDTGDLDDETVEELNMVMSDFIVPRVEMQMRKAAAGKHIEKMKKEREAMKAQFGVGSGSSGMQRVQLSAASGGRSSSSSSSGGQQAGGWQTDQIQQQQQFSQLSALGISKLKEAISKVKTLDELEVLDKALKSGRIPTELGIQLGVVGTGASGEEGDENQNENQKRGRPKSRSRSPSRRSSRSNRSNKSPKSEKSAKDDDDDEYDPLKDAGDPEEGVEGEGANHGQKIEDEAQKVEDETQKIEESMESVDGDDVESMESIDSFEDDDFEDVDEYDASGDAANFAYGEIDDDSPSAKKRRTDDDSQSAKYILVYVRSKGKISSLRQQKLRSSDFWLCWKTLIRHTRQHSAFQKWVAPSGKVRVPPAWERVPLSEDQLRAQVAAGILVEKDSVEDKEDAANSAKGEKEASAQHNHNDSTTTPASQNKRCRVVGLATSTIYVGDIRVGFDPKHLARITVVDDSHTVLLDTLVRPTLTPMDTRFHQTHVLASHLTEQFAVDFETARQKLIDVLGAEETIVVGHCLQQDAHALRLCLRPEVVDVALLFDVEAPLGGARKGKKDMHKYHPLRTLAEQIIPSVPKSPSMDDPFLDNIEYCKWVLHIAHQQSEHLNVGLLQQRAMIEANTGSSFNDPNSNLKPITRLPYTPPALPSRTFPRCLKISHISKEFRLAIRDMKDGSGANVTTTVDAATGLPQQLADPTIAAAEAVKNLLPAHLRRWLGKKEDEADATANDNSGNKNRKTSTAPLRISPINWKLSESDPTDWRGECCIVFKDEILRDSVFETLDAATDVYVDFSIWAQKGIKGRGKAARAARDGLLIGGGSSGKGAGKGRAGSSLSKGTKEMAQISPLDDVALAAMQEKNRPILSRFLTPKVLMRTFSQFGMVVGSRIPCKPYSSQILDFGFVSFLRKKDALTCETESKDEGGVEVRLGLGGENDSKKAAVTIKTSAFVAKHGNQNDKRVPIALRVRPGKGAGVADLTDKDLMQGVEFLHVLRK